MQSNLKKTFILLTFFLTCFPILTFVMRSILTALWFICGVFFYFKENKLKTTLNKDIWLFLMPFLALIISLIYSANISYGLGVLIKMVSFVILPIGFYLNRDTFNKENQVRLLYTFCFSVLILIFYQIIKVLFNLDVLLQDLTAIEIKANGYYSITEITEDAIAKIKLRRFRNYIINISNTHTTYQGLWISFSIFFLLSRINKLKNKFLKLFNIFTILVLGSWLFLISARMPIVALLISSILTLVFFANFSRVKLLRLGFVSILLMAVVLSFKNPFSIRVKEFYKTGLVVLKQNSKANEFNSVNVRNGIYYCGFELVKENPFLGTGVGDVQDELNKCYSNELSAKIYTWHTFNTHNQFLFFWLSSGLIGLISFLFLMYNLFYSAFKTNNKFLFFTATLLFFIFFTENLLERSDGIIFYSLFTSLFYLQKIKN